MSITSHLLSRLGVTGILLALWLPAPANACSCAAYPSDIDKAVALAHSQVDVIFLGEATSVRTNRLVGYPRRETRFDVDTVWKGRVPDPTVVVSNVGEVSCGYKFSKGRRYLVFAWWDPDKTSLSTSFCDLTRAERESADAIVVLDNIAKQARKKGWQIPLESALQGTEFALFHDLWSVSIPNGKALVFNVDRTISVEESHWDGNTWEFQGDTLIIDGAPFRYSEERQCLFSKVSDEFPNFGACIVPRGQAPKYPVTQKKHT